MEDVELKSLAQIGRIEKEFEVIKDVLTVKLHTLGNKDQEDISDILAQKETQNKDKQNLAFTQKTVLRRAITSINSKELSKEEIVTALDSMQTSVLTAIYVKYMDCIENQNTIFEQVKKN